MNDQKGLHRNKIYAILARKLKLKEVKLQNIGTKALFTVLKSIVQYHDALCIYWPVRVVIDTVISLAI